ncbi:MAG TPA: hypothetical protein VN229_02365 [Terriglobales bacterium]|nr:hypothetical protein [Terriglobales bacterium]
MNLFLDNLLDTFRVLTFQWIPSDEVKRRNTPGECEECFERNYAERRDEPLARPEKTVLGRSRKPLQVLLTPPFRIG